MKHIQKKENRRKLQRRKGQNVAEYAILIALVVGAVIAMQKFAQRGLQARIRDVTAFMVDETPELGTVAQYEPYYSESQYATTRSANETKTLTGDTNFTINATTLTSRDVNGYQTTSYDDTQTITNGMTF